MKVKDKGPHIMLKISIFSLVFMVILLLNLRNSFNEKKNTKEPIKTQKKLNNDRYIMLI
jgi:hypothetical protein